MMSKIIRGSNFQYCITRGQQLGPKIRYIENTELKVIRGCIKCFVSLQAIWWPSFINILSSTLEFRATSQFGPIWPHSDIQIN